MNTQAVTGDMTDYQYIRYLEKINADLLAALRAISTTASVTQIPKIAYDAIRKAEEK